MDCGKEKQESEKESKTRRHGGVFLHFGLSSKKISVAYTRQRAVR